MKYNDGMAEKVSFMMIYDEVWPVSAKSGPCMTESLADVITTRLPCDYYVSAM